MKMSLICICNRMDSRAITDWFHAYFQSFHKTACDEGNLENFENTSEINP